MTAADSVEDEATRAARLSRRRGGRRRVWIGTTVAIVVVAGGIGAWAAFAGTSSSASAGTTDESSTTTSEPSTTTTVRAATTTTIPAVAQPADVAMPAPGRLSYGSRSGVVQIYEARMKALHFDPGPVDGKFDQDTQYAVVAVQKYFNQPRTGVIDAGVQQALSHFQYTPQAATEANRVEIDLDRQVLTVYTNWQPILITTTSTGSGEHFCGGVDGCQYAITPTGHYHFYSLYKGWDNGKLGKMWNPYYFNGGIAVHGLQSVPASPASHGCARIPMHVADYFYTLVQKGESVFVLGTAKKAGSGYIGPAPTAPKTTTTTPTFVVTPTSAPAATTTLPHTTTTAH